MKDGGLRPLFRQKFPTFQWTSVETAGSATGVPDSEFCTPDGIQGWIEFKQTKIFFVNLKPFQTSWLDQRCRYGGNAWIAVRRIPVAKMYEGDDELWLIHGSQAIALHEKGLTGVTAMRWKGGPGNWDFNEVFEYITRRKIL